MGADFFVVLGEGNSAEEVFLSLRADAQLEHGNQGYTGTIAEKSEFRMVKDLPGIEDLKNWTDWERHLFSLMAQDKLPTETDDKWGPCGCIQYGVREYEQDEFAPATTHTMTPGKPSDAFGLKIVYQDPIWIDAITIGGFKLSDTDKVYTKALELACKLGLPVRVERDYTNPVEYTIVPGPRSIVKVKKSVNKYVFFGWASC